MSYKFTEIVTPDPGRTPFSPAIETLCLSVAIETYLAIRNEDTLSAPTTSMNDILPRIACVGTRFIADYYYAKVYIC